MLQKLQWDSLQQRRARSKVLMLNRIRNGQMAIPALAYPKPPTAYTRGSETRYRQIQCNAKTYRHTFFHRDLPVKYFTGRRLSTAATLHTASKLNWTQSSWCKCLSALFLFSELHRFYLLIVITVCYRLHHRFRFTHLDSRSHRGAILLNLSWHLFGRRRILVLV